MGCERDLDEGIWDWARAVASQDPGTGLVVLLSLLPNLARLGLKQPVEDWRNEMLDLVDGIFLAGEQSSCFPNRVAFTPMLKLRSLDLDNIDCLSETLEIFKRLPNLNEIHLRSWENTRYEWDDDFDHQHIKTIILHDCYCHRLDVIAELLRLFRHLERLVCCCTGRLTGWRERIYKRLCCDEDLQDILLKDRKRMAFAKDRRGTGFVFTSHGHPLIDKPSGLV